MNRHRASQMRLTAFTKQGNRITHSKIPFLLNKCIFCSGHCSSYHSQVWVFALLRAPALRKVGERKKIAPLIRSRWEFMDALNFYCFRLVAVDYDLVLRSITGRTCSTFVWRGGLRFIFIVWCPSTISSVSSKTWRNHDDLHKNQFIL